MSDFFWFSDEQRARIEPLLPTDTRGMPRANDRRVLSGIIHALKNGGRWTDCPRDVYGPKKTLYNRFVRWAERGVWKDIFAALAGAGMCPTGCSSTAPASRFTAAQAAEKGGLGAWYRRHRHCQRNRP